MNHALVNCKPPLRPQQQQCITSPWKREACWKRKPPLLNALSTSVWHLSSKCALSTQPNVFNFNSQPTSTLTACLLTLLWGFTANHWATCRVWEPMLGHVWQRSTPTIWSLIPGQTSRCISLQTLNSSFFLLPPIRIGPISFLLGCQFLEVPTTSQTSSDMCPDGSALTIALVPVHTDLVIYGKKSNAKTDKHISSKRHIPPDFAHEQMGRLIPFDYFCRSASPRQWTVLYGS